MKKLHRSCLVTICVLAIGLAALPAWAGDGIGFSLRVHGGYSYLQAKDANTGAGGWFDFYQLLADLQGLTTTGAYSPFHGGYDFGGDLIFQLTPRIGVGLGIGYLKSSEDPEMTISDLTTSVLMTGRPQMSAMPIRLGLYGTWPLTGKWNFTVNAGAAYYANVKFDALLRLEDDTSGDWMEQRITASMNRLSNIGFQGGLGLEYALSPRMFVFVEANGRYASFKNFATATGTSDSSLGTPQEDIGKIYLETNIMTEGTWTWFVVSDTAPTPEPGVLEYREPKFDFSGFSLQVGFRIRF
jgi:opacity protein-like surface antigen